MQPVDRSHELRPAMVLAVVAFLVFALLIAGIVTDTFALDDRVAAWVGVGLVGLASATFAAWAIVIHRDVDLPWEERLGGDLVIVGLAAAFVMAGLPTFAAGVI